jgi:hypothetical protein
MASFYEPRAQRQKNDWFKKFEDVREVAEFEGDRRMHQADDDIPFAADAKKISASGRGSPSRG